VFLFRARLFHFITELSEHDAAREDLLITFNDPRACMQSNADLISIEKMTFPLQLELKLKIGQSKERK